MCALHHQNCVWGVGGITSYMYVSTPRGVFASSQGRWDNDKGRWMPPFAPSPKWSPVIIVCKCSLSRKKIVLDFFAGLPRYMYSPASLHPTTFGSLSYTSVLESVLRHAEAKAVVVEICFGCSCMYKYTRVQEQFNFWSLAVCNNEEGRPGRVSHVQWCQVDRE